MMNKSTLLVVLLIFHSCVLFGQELMKTKNFTADEITYLRKIANKIAKGDQKYRSYLTFNTLDDKIITKIDSIMDQEGMAKGIQYAKSLNLSLNKTSKDSLILLQHEIDFENHLLLRGIFSTYGFLPKKILKEKYYIQQLLLLHPYKDWDVRHFQKTYANLLLPEVKAGRMQAKEYALFYDNILCKILREPQLYGTNQKFDSKSGTILAPDIRDLEIANRARKAIGMPPLKEGEYRIVK